MELFIKLVVAGVGFWWSSGFEKDFLVERGSSASNASLPGLLIGLAFIVIVFGGGSLVLNLFGGKK